MRLSTRVQYGTRALLDLALHQDHDPVSLKDIARRQRLSLAYLQHLAAPLVSAGIVKSTRGSRGGILLAKRPEQIRLIDAYLILEGPVVPVDCLKDPKHCDWSGSCATQDIWNDMGKAMEKVLESNTLRDLMDRQKSKVVHPDAMYYI